MKNLIFTIAAMGMILLAGCSANPDQETPGPASLPPEQASEQASDQTSMTVTYSDSGYSPAVLRVKAGETVTFKNESSRGMWTASAVHPTHTNYPTSGGCLGSTFDACQGIQPGQSWSFRFDERGTWKYHNHVRSGDTGAIEVE